MNKAITATLLVDKWTGEVTIRIKGLSPAVKNVLRAEPAPAMTVSVTIHGDDQEPVFTILRAPVGDEVLGANTASAVTILPAPTIVGKIIEPEPSPIHHAPDIDVMMERLARETHANRPTELRKRK